MKTINDIEKALRRGPKKVTKGKKPTEHNPTNFEPSDYTILGYIDNQPPQVSPMADWSSQSTADAYKALREDWQRRFADLFPKSNAYKCEHCGQGNVRYVVSARHEPTGEHVCFGDICCDRLGFANHSAFAAKMIRSAAATAMKKHQLEADQAKFLKENESFAEAYRELIDNPTAHERNSFARDVAFKFQQYGSLSEKQVASFISSIARDNTFAAQKAKDAVDLPPLEEGKLTLNGIILTLKLYTNEVFGGSSWKITLRLLNGNKVWGTLPAAIGEAQVGNHVEFAATVMKSDKDEHFGFFKRPSKAKIIDTYSAPTA